MRHSILALALGLGGTLAAQTQMPLPNFTSTFSAAAGTRGFFFQAPISFLIVGLRVPDESAQGVQNVEVQRLPAAPPLYPATATGTTLFYSAGQPSSQILSTAILVNQGDWIGILGACGTTSMANSYGASPFSSSILGTPVTISRFLTQTNLASVSNQPHSTENGGSIARVEVYVAPTSGYALATPYGAGCYDLSRSVYEQFTTGASFDLANTAMTAVFTGSSYLFVPAGTYVPPTATATVLALPANGEVNVTLPGPMPTPSGNVTALTVCSEGYVSGGTGNPVSATPSATAWLSSTVQRWGDWHDFNPAATGGGRVKYEVVGTIAYVTWDGVYDNGQTVPNTFQLQFETTSGQVTYVWQNMSGLGNGHLVGYAAAGTSRDRGSVDISTALLAGTLQTAANDNVPLTLAATGRPVLGQQFTLQSTNIPASASIGVHVFSATEITAGIDLGPFGMPGCRQFVNVDAPVLYLPASGSASLTANVPNDPNLAGVNTLVQSVAFASGFNPLGVITSNGLRLTTDVQ